MESGAAWLKESGLIIQLARVKSGERLQCIARCLRYNHICPLRPINVWDPCVYARDGLVGFGYDKLLLHTITRHADHPPDQAFC